MNKLILTFTAVFVFTGSLMAQECGPGCPVCSGGGTSIGALLEPRTIVTNYLYIPGGEEETGVINIRAGASSWMDVGMGYSVDEEKIHWSARIQAVAESESLLRPAVILGTGSVQTGGSDQSLYLQMTKAWEFSEVFSMRISTGAASLLPDLAKLYALGGITFTIADKWSPFISYDGVSNHPGLMWLPFEWLNIGGIYVESKYAAVSASFRFTY